MQKPAAGLQRFETPCAAFCDATGLSMEAGSAPSAPSAAFQLKGWRFESKSGPILNTGERDALLERLNKRAAQEFVGGLPYTVPPLPEAIFGHNRVTLTHEASGRAFHFDADGALSCWARESAHKGSGGLRVTTASLPSWKHVADEQRVAEKASVDYDWTFSTNYCGTTSTRAPPGEFAGPGSHIATARRENELGLGSPSQRVGSPCFIESPFCTKVEYEAWLVQRCEEACTVDGGTKGEAAAESQWTAHKGSGLDMALLRRRDVPILHFVDFVLYEDDLGDNGESVVRLRLRVMPTCFLLLLRHALRVDGLLIRHHDTRIFHKFGTPHVLRTRRLAEAPLEPVRKPDLSDKPNKLDKLDVAPVPPWCATATVPASRLASLGSSSLPDEQQAAEKLALLSPKSESLEELLL